MKREPGLRVQLGHPVSGPPGWGNLEPERVRCGYETRGTQT
jgi:hypothetical protein